MKGVVKKIKNKKKTEGLEQSRIVCGGYVFAILDCSCAIRDEFNHKKSNEC